MNKIERIKMVKAMEFITRQLNDEELFMSWLMDGVADGDIRYGDLSPNENDEEDMEYYIEDATFADLMDEFLRLMWFAYDDNSGLYCDDIVSAGKFAREKVSGYRKDGFIFRALCREYDNLGKDDEEMLKYMVDTLRMTKKDIQYFTFGFLWENRKKEAEEDA